MQILKRDFERLRVNLSFQKQLPGTKPVRYNYREHRTG